MQADANEWPPRTTLQLEAFVPDHIPAVHGYRVPMHFRDIAQSTSRSRHGLPRIDQVPRVRALFRSMSKPSIAAKAELLPFREHDPNRSGRDRNPLILRVLARGRHSHPPTHHRTQSPA